MTISNEVAQEKFSVNETLDVQNATAGSVGAAFRVAQFHGVSHPRYKTLLWVKC